MGYGEEEMEVFAEDQHTARLGRRAVLCIVGGLGSIPDLPPLIQEHQPPLQLR